MGKSQIVPLVVLTKLGNFVSPWHTKQDGKPTNKNLSDFRDAFNQSLKKGGANEHLGVNHWLLTDLKIVSQITGKILATHKAPMFEIIN